MRNTTMPAEYPYIDATNNPDALSRAAKEVVKSRRSQLVKIGDDEVVQVSPIDEESIGDEATSDTRKSILNLVGLADDLLPEDTPTQVITAEDLSSLPTKVASPNDPLLKLAGMFDSQGPGDVGDNKQAYL